MPVQGQVCTNEFQKHDMFYVCGGVWPMGADNNGGGGVSGSPQIHMTVWCVIC